MLVKHHFLDNILPVYVQSLVLRLFVSKTQAFTSYMIKLYVRPEYNFFKPGIFLRLFGRNDAMSDKVTFRLEIRQNLFLKKIRTSRICNFEKF